jgi:hypothetical protein
MPTQGEPQRQVRKQLAKHYTNRYGIRRGGGH